MVKWTLSSHHKDSYGNWEGRPNGFAPDPSRCAYEVFPNERGVTHHQCHKKRGYGPEEAFCKIHDPAAIKARQRASEKKYKLDFWRRIGRRSALANVGQALLDHLDQKCSFEDVERSAQEYREELAKYEAISKE